MSFYEGSFQGGDHFLMHRLIREFLGFLSLSPAELAPNAWQMMISSIIVWLTSNKREDSFTLEELLYCYRHKEESRVLVSLTQRDRAKYHHKHALIQPYLDNEFLLCVWGWLGTPCQSTNQCSGVVVWKQKKKKD